VVNVKVANNLTAEHVQNIGIWKSLAAQDGRRRLAVVGNATCKFLCLTNELWTGWNNWYSAFVNKYLWIHYYKPAIALELLLPQTDNNTENDRKDFRRQNIVLLIHIYSLGTTHKTNTDKIECVQQQAARFMVSISDYDYSSSVTGILAQCSLDVRRQVGMILPAEFLEKYDA